MNTARKALYLKLAGGIAIISSLVYAAMTFSPATQPATNLAPYAFDSGNLLSGSTRAFRPWFENGAWQGDLIEYFVDADGIRTTDADVGSNPPTATGSNWMARATFADKEATITDYWKESTSSSDGRRQIFTVNSDTGDQVDFLWDNLSDSQKAALDQDTLDASLTGSYDSPILNFIRGDRSNEKSGTGGTLRLRFSLLGDIINSNPVFMGAPEEAYVIEGFPTYKFANASRAGRIAVGANDGMLHIFDASDGSEVYAYIPSMVIDNLGKLANAPYVHTYYVDGELFYGSAYIDSSWKSVLTGGLGAGGRGLFILDVTSPAASDNKVMYEITGSDVGYIYGKPRLGRVVSGDSSTWNVFTGNGYGTGGHAKLLMISLEDGSTSSISTGVNGGLSAPALVSGADRVVDYVFAGDSNGDMWKFNIADGDATKIFDGSPDRPIMTAPVVGAHPNGGFIVFFGTGNKTSYVDATDPNYPTQAIYGIWDSAIGDTIVQQYLEETTATFTTDDGEGNSTSNTEDVRYMVDSGGDPGNATVDYAGSCYDPEGGTNTCAMGWMVELPNTGERVLGTPSLRAGRVSVVTSNPIGTNGDPDLDGDSWLMSLYYLTGGDGDDVSFNLSGDSILNADDRFTVDGLSIPPTGISLGDGMISQPAIVRVADGIDMVFINGLRLPLPQVLQSGTFLNGHIDVETDSPTQDLTGVWKGGREAPDDLSRHSEGYNVRTSDGLGRGVDGHVHDYDTIHDVSWVDYFELEPRRGLGNLAALPIPLPGTGCPDGSITVLDEAGDATGCVEEVGAELNRAYDTYGSPDTNLAVSPPNAAEVFARDSNVALESDQRFIVILANADLTAGGKLQIGCRVWDIEQYQDMITYQLENGVVPAELDDCPENGPECPDNIHNSSLENSLVFTLDSIANRSYVDTTGTLNFDSEAGDCDLLDEDEGLSKQPTLRIGFNQRSILDGGIHGTRSQCVLGLHDYRDPVCYSDAEVLAAAETAFLNPAEPHPVELYDSCPGLPETPPDDYIRDPALNLHLTESLEGNGGKWRTRNGALTLQLLKVNKENSDREFNLQSDEFLPQTTRGQNTERFGGTYAQMFTSVSNAGGTRYPVAGDTSDLDEGEGVWPESGLLYESTLYWHYSDLADILRRGDPASIPCYGDANYNSAVTQELGGLTLGEYQDLISGLGDEDTEGSLISEYSTRLNALLEAIAEGDQNAVNQALLDLGQLLADNADTLGQYDRFRDYAPGHIPEQHLLDLDKDLDNPGGGGGGGGSADDGTPVDVDDLEGFGMGGGSGSGGGLAGNDVLEGLRIWIDPRD